MDATTSSARACGSTTRNTEIVGVAAPGFGFPTAGRPPLDAADAARRRTTEQVRVFPAIGRLKAGITAERAASEGTAAARGVKRPIVADLLFGKGGPVEVRVVSALDDAIGTVKPALVALTVGVVLVLLVGCANVANLLLSSGVARRRELAVRAALGASRGRLLRLILIECGLLAGLGLSAGLVLAQFIVDALPVAGAVGLPAPRRVALDGRVVAISGARRDRRRRHRRPPAGLARQPRRALADHEGRRRTLRRDSRAPACARAC